ncbi:MAG: chaperone modulator CbpM [Pseudomonadota bacterium]
MSHTEETVLIEIRRLTRRELRLWMREGWVRPMMSETGPRFDELDVARLRLLCDLCKDMALSPDAVQIVLNLMDQLHQARRDLRTVMGALNEQPDDVRNAIAATLRARRFGSRSDTHD